MRWISSALMAWPLVGACSPSGPLPRAGDAPRVIQVPQQTRDSLQRWSDSVNGLAREFRLGSGPIDPKGPALIAVYPWLAPGAELTDPELAGFVTEFRAGLGAARTIARAAGLAYWERYGPSISLADPSNALPLRPSVGEVGVGYVVVVPGYPPRTLIGLRSDSVLAGAVAEYLAEIRALQTPPEVGS